MRDLNAASLYITAGIQRDQPVLITVVLCVHLHFKQTLWQAQLIHLCWLSPIEILALDYFNQLCATILSPFGCMDRFLVKTSSVKISGKRKVYAYKNKLSPNELFPGES